MKQFYSIFIFSIMLTTFYNPARADWCTDEQEARGCKTVQECRDAGNPHHEICRHVCECPRKADFNLSELLSQENELQCSPKTTCQMRKGRMDIELGYFLFEYGVQQICKGKPAPRGEIICKKYCGWAVTNFRCEP